MNEKKYSPSILVVISILVMLVYAVVRVILFLIAAYSLVDYVFSIILILGEFFILIHAFGYGINMFRVITKKPAALPPDALSGEEASVAVLLAARHEPRQVLEKTFITINAMNYKNKAVYFLDDSSDEKYKKEAEELCREYHLKLFTRSHRHGAKAGIINDCLKTLEEKYIALFDADDNPLPEFLNVTVPLLENDVKLAFLQTPQFYSNIGDNLVSRGAAFQQAVFYEYICEGKSTEGAMFCCGTNVVFRREALVSVGGLDESTVTEDFATSIKFLIAGWRSQYYDHVYAFGMAPQDLTGYFKQQFRWAIGTISVFRKILQLFITNPFSLKPVQWWEYFLSSTFYFIGIAFFFLMICPVVYLLFQVPSFFAHPDIYFMAFVPYFILSLAVFYAMLAKRKYRFTDMLLGQLLGIITFPVYIQAAAAALLGIKVAFGVTGKAEVRAISYSKLWPQILIIFINFIAIVWGLNRYIYGGETAILVCVFWSVYSIVTLSTIFYFNGECR